ncbi:putative C6 transcription factor [Talaromyces proteolyticus]|uniref:C6 transcription factor n=1 Tax=Talaromyces proteolyticus TaxID=1131652 RepID=A0AAD4KTV2_9EURO|nr:putative C6 transcription factor [Talaromyces proteolyticus]KAH8695984.1 putative C6 transcription factor [Talaromyces proteolyticus]
MESSRVNVSSTTTGHVEYNPRKRHRTACSRCKTRKQKCDNDYPCCSNCRKAGVECDKVSLNLDNDNGSGYTRALEDRVAYLESRLSESLQSRTADDSILTTNASHILHPMDASQRQTPDSSQRVLNGSTGTLGEIVGFLSLGAAESPAYVGSSSGLSLAVNLGEMVRATVMTKAFPSPSTTTPRADSQGGNNNLAGDSTEHPSRAIKLNELLKHRADPPSDEMGSYFVNVYLSRVHSRYPFIDRDEIWKAHEDRGRLGKAKSEELSRTERFGIFRLYMVYAIAATIIQLGEKYTYTAPEKYYVTAIQHVAAACETNSTQNVEAMLLLVIYHLRSATTHGLWYIIGLAMRTCIDLGLHRRTVTAGLDPFTIQLRRRLFWAVYYLERAISLSLGRPCSISDRHIDIDLPLDVDDHIRDSTTLTTLQPSTGITTLSLFRAILSIRLIESKIQHSIYRADRPLQEMRPKMDKIYNQLEEWKNLVLPRFGNDLDFPVLHYNRAVRLLIQPFLPLLPVTDPYYHICIRAAGDICQGHKKLHQTLEYGHSFLAVQTVFVAGITLLYALWTNTENVWSVRMSNDIRACSTVLFVMTERAPWVKRYRDAFELLVNAAMEKLQGNEAAASSGMAGMMVAQGYGNSGQNGGRSVPAPIAMGIVAPTAVTDTVAPQATIPPGSLQTSFHFDIDEDAMRMAMELAPWIDQDLGEGASTPLWMPDFDTLQNIAGPYQY